MLQKEFGNEKLVDFRKILSIIQKNFIVISRDKARLIPLTIFPIIMILIFGFTSGNAPKHIQTAVIAYDNSLFSERVVAELSSSEVLSVSSVLSTEGEGKNMLDSGKVKALVEIPPNIQDKLDNGETVFLTIMVDASDSSVAETVRQAVRSATSSLSSKLSAEKIASFQKSVGAASGKIEAYSAAGASQDSLIASKSRSAADALQAVDRSLKKSATALENSLATPIVGNFKSSSTNSTTASINETFLIEPAGYAATKAQAASYRYNAELVETARANALSAADIADKQAKSADAGNDYLLYRENVELPKEAIGKFTAYDANTIVKPLSYEEKAAYGTGRRVVDFLIPAIIALTIFQGAVMGMGRAIAGERREGSLTRVFLTPTSNVTIILGTLLFYVMFEILRSTIMMLFAMNLFHIKVEGSLLAVFVVIVIYAGVSTAIGMFLSSLVKSEQQYLGLSMLVSMPTIFLSGAFLPVQAMPKALQGLAGFLPITYAADALRAVMIKGLSIGLVSRDLMILSIFLAVTLGGVFMVFRRDIE